MFAYLGRNARKRNHPFYEFKKVWWPHTLDHLDPIIVEIEIMLHNITKSFLLYILQFRMLKWEDAWHIATWFIHIKNAETAHLEIVNFWIFVNFFSTFIYFHQYKLKF